MELLRYQIEYAAWANERVLSAASKLTPAELDHDFKSSEHTIRGTLAHIYRAERVWLARIEGEPADFRVPGDDALEALTGNWPGLSSRWIEFAKAIRPEFELVYRDLKNNPWTQPLWKIVLHVVNHSTHHRGQAVGFIRALGYTPPSTDSITFARLLGA